MVPPSELSRTGTTLSDAYALGVASDLHAAVAARLADHDGRYTGARRDLIEVLAAAGRPLTVDEIVLRAPRQRPSSVYRNLAVFETEGVVHRMAGVGEFARFELTEALVGHHHHLACRVCGAMTDVHLPHELESELDRVLADLAHTEGFELSSHVLDAVGVCHACSESSRAHGGRPRS
jgi:Fe2+ or Zn2+ uptake regulation protein